MSCASRCYEIGGPWITYDPNCPIHGDDARERGLLQSEVDRMRDEEIKYLKRRNKELQDEIDRLKEQVKTGGKCQTCASGVWCKMHETDGY